MYRVFGVTNAHQPMILKAKTIAERTRTFIEKNKSLSSVIQTKVKRPERFVWKLPNKDLEDSFVSAFPLQSLITFVSNLNYKLYNLYSRGWSMAASNSTMRVRSWKRSDGRVQLGCFTERSLLGKMLLFRRWLQRFHKIATFTINFHSHNGHRCFIFTLMAKMSPEITQVICIPTYHRVVGT